MHENQNVTQSCILNLVGIGKLPFLKNQHTLKCDPRHRKKVNNMSTRT